MSQWTGNAAAEADVSWDALQSHDGNSAGLFGDARLLGGNDVHDDAALEHLRETGLGAEGRSLGVGGSGGVCVVGHGYEGMELWSGFA